MTSGHALRSWLGRHPVLKAAIGTVLAPVRGGVSSGYRRVAADQSAGRGAALRGAWQNEGLPAQQRRLVDQELAAIRSGGPSTVPDNLVRLIRPLVQSFARSSQVSLLEIGCSSGYYSEIFESRHLGVAYHGCDYSPAFVRMAKQYYPAVPFSVADGASMPMRGDAFDIVLSGCCLLHIPEYDQAICESARIARRYVVFHRTPILQDVPTRYFTKRAYGVDTIEIHFNEEEFVSLLAKHGLAVVAVSTLDVSWKSGAMYATKDYVCEKRAVHSELPDAE
jgi:SAM-dependent methyltransferase